MRRPSLGRLARRVRSEGHAQEQARLNQIGAALDLVESPAFSSLVGPVDVHRIAAGGHSYAGSIAFNTSLHDTRVAAVFDLDGRLFGEAAAVPTKVPSLIVTSSGSGTTGDAQMYEVARLGAKTVAVGLLRSDHFDLTDAAAIEKTGAASSLLMVPAAVAVAIVAPPVGALKPNPWGLYDMHGYLWELTADGWSDTHERPPTDGSAVKAGQIVLRSGSWKDSFPSLTSTSRRQFSMTAADDAVGFRCVKAREP